MNEMAAATRDGIGLLNLKKTGSISYDTKHKLLLERWLTPHQKMVEDANTDENPHLKVIQRNVHVNLEMCEDKGTMAKKAVENYHVLAIYTTTYNK